MKKTVCVIPARGGSKGIPNKNITFVNGLPLISYAINAALKSNIDEVWVSTDSSDIEDVAIEAGAKVVKRPKNLATDDTTTDDVLVHFAECVEFSDLVTIQCTSPLTLSDDLDGGLELYLNNPGCSVMSVCIDSGGWLCGGYSWCNTDSGLSRINYKDEGRDLRQAMVDNYRENGAYYITSKESLLSSKLRMSGKILPYIMPRQRSFEVDELADLYELSKYFTRL